MLSFSDLKALSEASTGFVGGTGVDYFPELSLTEATAALPIAIMECQCEQISDINKYNQALMETTMSSMTMGGLNESAMDMLTEAASGGLKQRVTSFFDKILKFIRSILEKLKFQINRMTMSGKKLWSTYKDSARAKATENFKNFTYNGYKNMLGEDKVTFTSAAKYDKADGGEELINDVLKNAKIGIDHLVVMSDVEYTNNDENGVKAGKMTNSEETNAAIKEDKKVLTDLESGEVKAKMAEKLTGITGLDTDWKETVTERLYGDKEDLTYGTDFNITQIGEICSKPQDLEKIANEYAKFESGVNAWKKKVEGAVSKLEKGKDKAEGDVNRAGYTAMIESMNAYLARLNDAYAVISEVKNLRVTYYKAKNTQAQTILAKLLALGGKKTKKSDEDEDVSFADPEFLAFE